MVRLRKHLVVFNAGSSSLKWALYDADNLRELGRGIVERIGSPGSFTEWRLQGKVTVQKLGFATHAVAARYVLRVLAWQGIDLANLVAVGHRVVHGGNAYAEAQLITAAVRKQVARFSSLAPLHNPPALAVIRELARVLPRVKQVAVFDTAWFAQLPERAREYALPAKLVAGLGLRRYGFHGISHAYVAHEAARLLKRPLEQLNLVTCHLGAGCSVTAVRGGRPIDTSMGFTPLEGLVMGTRAGDIDPGVVLYLLRQGKMTVAKLEHLLQNESGLKGVAGVADMREVLVRAGYEVLGFKNLGRVSRASRKRAQLALKLFLYRLQKYIGAYAAILGRVDAIVFTGGIGERNEVVRSLTMHGLPTLKDVPVLTIATNEELAIARELAIKIIR